MSWESIVAFAVIALVSSLVNKGKNQTTNRKTINPPRPVNSSSTVEAPTTSNPSRPMPPRTTVKSSTNRGKGSIEQQPSKRQRTTGGLEGMFRELQRNMEDMFQQSIEKQETVKPDPIVKDQASAVAKELHKATPQNQPSVSLIKKQENGRGTIGKLRFDRQSVLQGVIMSEVLGKPKALKKY